ncbi:MAG: HAD family phosphatase [Planctomycetota bacterium]
MTDVTRGVVFDFDGVIVDSEPLHERACRDVARSEGMEFTHEQFCDECIGHGDRLAFVAICRLNGREPEHGLVDRLCAGKPGAFLRHVFEDPPSPHAGSVSLIHAAASAYPTAVCTGSRRDEVEPILDRLGVLDRLVTLVTADDVERTKPDPAPYVLAAKRLEVEPASCVAIEDTPTGIESAVGAGYRVLGVGHTLPAERLTRAHHVVDALKGVTLEELLSV